MVCDPSCDPVLRFAPKANGSVVQAAFCGWKIVFFGGYTIYAMLTAKRGNWGTGRK